MQTFPEFSDSEEVPVQEARCVLIRPDPIAFGATAVDELSVRTLLIENACDDEDLGVFGIAITANQGSVFSRESEFDGLEVLSPGDTLSVEIGFRPTSEQRFGGTILVETDDPLKNRMIVEMSGIGAAGDCPAAVARASLDGQTFTENIDEAPPLETVILDATASTPDGEIAEYQWTIIEKPGGSRANIAPAKQLLAQPDVFLDLVGTYIFEVQVRNEEGVSSCTSGRVTVIARAPAGHYLELMWEPVIDESLQPDLDLYYRRGDRRWGTNGDEVGLGTGDRDWGGTASLIRTAGDPATAPEVIWHQDPSDDVYFVGVHYANMGFGPVIAKLRIYADGQRVYEGTQRIQGGNDQEVFWDAVLISSDIGEVSDDGSEVSSFPL